MRLQTLTWTSAGLQCHIEGLKAVRGLNIALYHNNEDLKKAYDAAFHKKRNQILKEQDNE